MTKKNIVKDEVKRPPGRPALKKKQNIDKNGIVSFPMGADNIMELIYDGPLIFKKIFNIFKAMEASEIKIEFNTDEIKIITTDHLSNNINYLKIDCSKLNHYYCRHPSGGPCSALLVEDRSS